MNKRILARRRACIFVAAGASIGLLGSTIPALAPAAAAGAPAALTPLGLSQAASGVDDPDPVPVTDGSEVLQGKPMPPAGDVKGDKERQADAREDAGITAQATSEDITGFSLSAAYPKAVAAGQRPYEDFALSDPKGFGLVDSKGVRVFRFAGETKIWEHPVAQIQYGLINLNSYRLTKNRAYLDIAVANAQRNIDRKVESAGAWYYPYDFDFAVHGDTTETLKAPWYSAMAQGQALSLFVRLYEYTKDEKWKAAADATFASLRQAPEGTAPFASRVDGSGRLWFEEYPRYPVADSEQVLNGHIYAMYGLHDYLVLTEDPKAIELFRGGLRTVEARVPDGFRRVNWMSVYSLRHQVNTLSYHPVHMKQFQELWRLTHDKRWLQNALNYRTDFPNRYQVGTVRLSPRVKVMYRLGDGNKISQTRTVSFSRHTQAPFDRRQRINGGPIAYRISSGAYAGWWVAEGFGVAWGLGSIDKQVYQPRAFIMFRGGTTFTAYKLDSRGEVVGNKTLTIPTGRESGAPTSTNAIVQGRPAYYFDIGAFAGYWVPLQSKIYVDKVYNY